MSDVIALIQSAIKNDDNSHLFKNFILVCKFYNNKNYYFPYLLIKILEFLQCI